MWYFSVVYLFIGGIYLFLFKFYCGTMHGSLCRRPFIFRLWMLESKKHDQLIKDSDI